MFNQQRSVADDYLFKLLEMQGAGWSTYVPHNPYQTIANPHSRQTDPVLLLLEDE